jgi:hypothetical protein
MQIVKLHLTQVLSNFLTLSMTNTSAWTRFWGLKKKERGKSYLFIFYLTWLYDKKMKMESISCSDSIFVNLLFELLALQITNERKLL